MNQNYFVNVEPISTSLDGQLNVRMQWCIDNIGPQFDKWTSYTSGSNSQITYSFTTEQDMTWFMLMWRSS